MTSSVISMADHKKRQQLAAIHTRAAQRRADGLVKFARAFPFGYLTYTRDDTEDILTILPHLEEPAAMFHLSILRELADDFFAVSDSQDYDAHVKADEALGRLESAARDAVRADTEAAGAA